MFKNTKIPYAYIEEENICLVKTCSECCMTYINGKFNIRGMLHRMGQTIITPQRILANGYIIEESQRLDCITCPVHIKNVKTGEFDKILAEIDGTP